MSRHVRAEAPSLQCCTRLSPAERDRVDQAAAANHQTVSQFARDALVTAADDCLDPPRPPFVVRNPQAA
jgi:uncharacterized protein (DUF1778 family)